ncbi:MAG: nitroreductase family protein, partial [Clostridiales bacterium]
METLTAMAIRKSCRCYLDKPVEPEKLEILLKAANQAPKSGEI